MSLLRLMHDCRHCSNVLWDNAYEVFYDRYNKIRTIACVINVKVHISIAAISVSLQHLQEMKCSKLLLLF